MKSSEPLPLVGLSLSVAPHLILGTGLASELSLSKRSSPTDLRPAACDTLPTGLPDLESVETMTDPWRLTTEQSDLVTLAFQLELAHSRFPSEPLCHYPGGKTLIADEVVPPENLVTWAAAARKAYLREIGSRRGLKRRWKIRHRLAMAVENLPEH